VSQTAKGRMQVTRVSVKKDTLNCNTLR